MLKEKNKENRRNENTASLKTSSSWSSSSREAAENNGILKGEIRTSERDTHMFIMTTAVWGIISLLKLRNI